MSAPCRYATKKLFATENDAEAGAVAIRAKVESAGGVFQTLYPYRCPDGDHWHVSHYRQSVFTCRECEQEVPAWSPREGKWILTEHHRGDLLCEGRYNLLYEHSTELVVFDAAGKEFDWVGPYVSHREIDPTLLVVTNDRGDHQVTVPSGGRYEIRSDR